MPERRKKSASLRAAAQPPARSADIPSTAIVRRRPRKPDTPRRRLRVYALDPSIAQSLDSLPVKETVLSLPWDDEPVTREPLRPGPVGEYLEVVDVDPASGRVYEPVDLNDRALLAQDGWAPSEGNPQFHQQMVYAVGMTTIGHFEQALGRRALWAPHSHRDAKGNLRTSYVQRLRLYPHALRTNNAYYSPDKKALLFGYFPAESRDGDPTTTGSMVFTCLSSDIIAHEMTHALLDGLQRRFQEASNPDVPAFHEAFADIVALFQHFMTPELVRFEIGRERGDLTAAQLLSGLARQFGIGSSRGGPLRNYTDPKMKSLRYSPDLEAHELGSVLVFAVYEAFLRATAQRTETTIRLATGGSGVLPAGELHPGLIERLTEETCEEARYVLQMCIRALDYCPAVDITFGEYLRAIITADRDLVSEDRFGHRVAFMEAFRNRGILPRDVRTVSEETLAWGTLEEPQPDWLSRVLKGIDLRWDQDQPRNQIFQLNEDNRWALWRALKLEFQRDESLYAHFGLQPRLAKYDQSGRVVREGKKDVSTFDVFSVRPARRIAPDGSFRTELIAVIHQRHPQPLDGKDMRNGWFWFRGGATLIIDPRPGFESVRYSILKNSGSVSRQTRQREFACSRGTSSLRALYFGGDGVSEAMNAEPFALMHAEY